MRKQISPKIVSLTFGVLVISLVIAFYAIAWTEPTQAPPAGNVPAPLNTGSIGQEKIGGLILNTGGGDFGLIVDDGGNPLKGLVGIGTTPSPGAKLEVEGNIKLGGASPTYKLTNLILPTEGSDAVNKDYVDAKIVSAGAGYGVPMMVTFGYTTCPAGFTKAYEGIITAMWANGAASYTNVMGLGEAQASMSIVCMGNEFDMYNAHTEPWGVHNSGYSFMPLTRYNNYDRMIKCAVCVK